jgi:hypothetical protein
MEEIYDEEIHSINYNSLYEVNYIKEVFKEFLKIEKNIEPFIYIETFTNYLIKKKQLEEFNKKDSLKVEEEEEENVKEVVVEGKKEKKEFIKNINEELKKNCSNKEFNFKDNNNNNNNNNNSFNNNNNTSNINILNNNSNNNNIINNNTNEYYYNINEEEFIKYINENFIKTNSKFELNLPGNLKKKFYEEFDNICIDNCNDIIKILIEIQKLVKNELYLDNVFFNIIKKKIVSKVILIFFF